MKAKKAVGYECGSCGTIHEVREDAEECCPQEINDIDGWKCSECNEIYEEKEDADECCKE